MTPWLDDGDLQLYHGDAITVLASLPAGIAQTCITSPPYWGLRDYGTGTWAGGDAECPHTLKGGGTAKSGLAGWGNGLTQETIDRKVEGYGHAGYRDVCGKCGARRTDDQLGLEATPTEYVERIVAVFREVRRVLRDDGTLWLNLGDSYAAGTQGRNDSGRDFTGGGGNYQSDAPGPRVNRVVPGLKPKDLVGIPWRVAFALQADGWYLRSDIIWSKPNPMPESVTDRPTKAHEYVFLFSKQPRYYFDADAIREPADPGSIAREGRARLTPYAAPGQSPNRRNGSDGEWQAAGRNRRSVWTIPTEPFPEAHFATYPQELVRPCILAGSAVGDAVLDPFIGSGTTALIARKHGRRCIGIDLSADYLEIAAKRTRQLSLFGTPEEAP